MVKDGMLRAAKYQLKQEAEKSTYSVPREQEEVLKGTMAFLKLSLLSVSQGTSYFTTSLFLKIKNL